MTMRSYLMVKAFEQEHRKETLMKGIYYPIACSLVLILTVILWMVGSK